MCNNIYVCILLVYTSNGVVISIGLLAAILHVYSGYKHYGLLEMDLWLAKIVVM